MPTVRLAKPSSVPVPTTEGVLDQRLDSVPLAIVDIETTGVLPNDRIVEIAIARLDPGSLPWLAMHTLVRPDRPVAASNIHGILDDDLALAPSFPEIAADITAILAGCALAAYNAQFDVRFLRREFGRLGMEFSPPFVCLMHLQQLLRLGGCCQFHVACAHHDITLDMPHCAASDAIAAAQLWPIYLSRLPAGWSTFRDLRQRCRYSFGQSLSCPPLRAAGRPSEPSRHHVYAGDLQARAARIRARQLAEELLAQSRYVAAATAEMNAAEDMVRAANRLNEPIELAVVSSHLLAAQFALTSANVSSESPSYRRLLLLVEASARLAPVAPRDSQGQHHRAAA